MPSDLDQASITLESHPAIFGERALTDKESLLGPAQRFINHISDRRVAGKRERSTKKSTVKSTLPLCRLSSSETTGACVLSMGQEKQDMALRTPYDGRRGDPTGIFNSDYFGGRLVPRIISNLFRDRSAAEPLTICGRKGGVVGTPISLESCRRPFPRALARYGIDPAAHQLLMNRTAWTMAVSPGDFS